SSGLSGQSERVSEAGERDGGVQQRERCHPGIADVPGDIFLRGREGEYPGAELPGVSAAGVSACLDRASLGLVTHEYGTGRRHDRPRGEDETFGEASSGRVFVAE